MKGSYSHDLLASVVVFLVALPLCMGISIASGVPPALGLITGIVGGLVVGSLAGSPLQVSGPAAGLAVLVWELVRDHGIEALGPVLIVAGVLQFAAGSLRLGGWFRAMSPAVVHGMLAGIGVLILAAQFHVMLDDKPKSSGIANLLSIPAAIWGGIFPLNGSPHELAAVVGIVTIGSLVLWNLYKPEALRLIPGALVAVIAGTALAAFFNMPVKRIDVPANLLEAVRLPNMGSLAMLQQQPSLLISGLVMAFIASAETLLSAAAVDRMQQIVRTNYDKELRAQGVGNLICGLLGSLPMTGVIVRSSANVQAGARTRMAAILHGGWLLAFVALLPWLLRMIPTACLGAILVYTGYKLINLRNVRHLASYGRMPVVIYAATVIGIVVEDLLTGVLIGIGLTIVKLLYKVTHLEVAVVQGHGNRVDIYLSGAATFLKLPKLISAFESLPRNVDVHLHMEHLVYIDHSCLDVLFETRQQFESSGSTLHTEWDALHERFRSPNQIPKWGVAPLRTTNSRAS